jgi:hypothetical protein
MTRAKDLMTELQDKFGYDLEFLPENFDMDAFFKQRTEEIEKSELEGQSK